MHRVKKEDFLVIAENVPHQVMAFTPEFVMVTFEYPRGLPRALARSLEPLYYGKAHAVSVVPAGTSTCCLPSTM